MNYRLNVQAKEDLRRIYNHGVDDFGETQADLYYAAFFKRFRQIAEQPLLYTPVDHIREGYRRSVCGKDSIYYRIADDGIVDIMAVLGRQNVFSALKGR